MGSSKTAISETGDMIRDTLLLAVNTIPWRSGDENNMGNLRELEELYNLESGLEDLE